MKRKLSDGAKVGCNRHKTERCAVTISERCTGEKHIRKLTSERESDGRCAGEGGICADDQRECQNRDLEGRAVDEEHIGKVR